MEYCAKFGLIQKKLPKVAQIQITLANAHSSHINAHSSHINAHSCCQKQSDNFDESFKQKQNWKIFEGEMLIRTLAVTLLQMFCKITVNSKIIVKSMLDPDVNF